MSELAVAAANGAHQQQGQALAEQLGLPWFKVVSDLARCEVPVLLYVTDAGLQLQSTGKKAPGPVWADFLGGAVAHRRKFGGGSGQMIAKAVGIKSGVRPTVADVTAGLGRDSFVLATLGCEVQMVERSPVVHALLSDGLARAQLSLEVADIAEAHESGSTGPGSGMARSVRGSAGDLPGSYVPAHRQECCSKKGDDGVSPSGRRRYGYRRAVSGGTGLWR